MTSPKQTGFMDGHQANGAFVAVGPPGFTALALIKLGAKAREMYVLSSCTLFGHLLISGTGLCLAR